MTQANANVRVAPESNLLELAREVPAKGPLWMQRLRKNALSRFEERGLPTHRDEEWKQTSVSPIARMRFVHPRGDLCPLWKTDLGALPLGDLGCPTLVLVNGRYSAELSKLEGLPAGVTVESLASALENRPEAMESYLGRIVPYADRPFAALNTASIEDGAVIDVPVNATLDFPVHVLYLTTAGAQPTVSHPRTLLLLGRSSRATVIESYLGAEGTVYFNNAVTEAVVDDNATLDHFRVQWESPRGIHVGAVHGRVARNGTYNSLNVSLGASLARHDIGATLDGEGAEARLNGLYMVGDEQHVDHHTRVDHASPHCNSHELYKGILADRAVAVFNGRILVREGAQKTDARQSNKNLLLSDDALVHTRPQLEIYADDVKCTHGATIGHLEDDALFYLRSRGISEENARGLLIYGFARDVLEPVGFAALRAQLECELVTRVSRDLEIGGAS